MRKGLIISMVAILGLLPVFASKPQVRVQEAMPSDSLKADIHFGKLPLYFIPNRGQVHEKAKFYAKTSRYTLWMTKKGLVFDSIRKTHSPHSTNQRDVSRLVFVDSNRDPAMAPVDITSHEVNYLKGNDPSKWFTGIKTSKAVLYKDVYKNVDLKVYGIEKQVEYDWIVKPGADPEVIGFRYRNVKSTRIDEKGNLKIETRFGELTHKRPVSYQEKRTAQSAGRRAEKIAVDVQFKKIAENTYGFEVGEYDKGHELIIDPVIMSFSTYLGGSGDEHIFGLAVDGSGSAYVTGDTTNAGFPIDDAFQDTFGGGNIDAFVTKFSSSGSSLVYSTYLGGNGIDAGEGIRVAGNGYAFITGFTGSTDFPTFNPYQNTHGGGDKDVFVTILSPQGSSLHYSTYLGGSGDDEGFAIALDNLNNMYVTGRTGSTDFPTRNAYKDTFNGVSPNDYDAFVTKIVSTGSTLSYSTYLGGSGIERGYGIAVNGSNAFVAGRTTSTNFPTQSPFQGTHAGGQYDGFVTKLSSTGSSLVYSTYLGGSETDSCYGIVVNSSGNAFVTGDSYSTDFPVENAFQDTHAGTTTHKDAFVTKFAATGTTLDYSTYLGGVENDTAAHIAVDSSGNAFVTGSTESSDFPIKRAYQDSFNGDYDVFVSMLSSTGKSLSFSSYLGGGDFDSGRGIAVDDSGNIYLAGYSMSSDFPMENAFQDTLNGNLDGFVSKFSTSQFGTLCGAVDNCDLTWTTGGDADWFETTDDFYYDDDAARSGAIGDNQSNYLQTTVTGPGLLSFWWKVASEANFDFLSFYIDDQYQTSISGTPDTWSRQTYAISGGAHTLKWIYEKDFCCWVNSDAGWVDRVEFTPQPVISLSRTRLGFGAVPGTFTGDQTFSISNATASTLNWTAAPDQTWLNCTPTSGIDSGVVTVSVDATGLVAGTYNGSITVSDPNASNSPRTVAVTLNVFSTGGSSIPFGEYATPTDNSTISSSVPFTGWVLDDLGVQSVKLYRQDGLSQVYIGDAVFVEGARPDVEAAYPDYPYNYRAGWGYMMLTNFLPNGGNGTFIISAVATDIEGHQVILGSKMVTVDNANAVKPFGAIDTPTQGGSASGSGYRNQGWVLTPLPNTIPTDGTTINVYIDGVNLGHPTYNVYRPDIASLFPGYNNSNGAHAYFDFDTTAYNNGVHTIMWIATDNGANADGIGSRYFMIQNSSGSRMEHGAWSREQGAGSMGHGAWSMEKSTVCLEPVGIIKGYARGVEPRMIYPDEKGIIYVQIKELERLEIHLVDLNSSSFIIHQSSFHSGYSGYHVVGNEFRPLPVGSKLDTRNGIFYWQAGPGFVGDYWLMFIKKDEYGNMTGKSILVRILPKF